MISRSFALEPIYGSLPLAILLVVVTIVVVLLVTPPTADPRRRNILVFLRLLAAGVLVLSFLRPSIVRTDNRPAAASLIVALDQSQSMTLSDGDGAKRFDTQIEVVKELVQALSDLDDLSGGSDDSLTIKLLAYGDETKPLSVASVLGVDSPNETAIQADAPLTDLSLALTESIRSAQGQPMTGVVLVGDGNHNAPVQGAAPASVARTLDSIGVALWTVPVGPPAGTADSRDAAIDALADSYQLFSGNQVAIDFQVQTTGLAGIDVPIRLSWVELEGNKTEFATRIVRPDQARASQAMVVSATAPAPGTYQLVVEADVQDGETLTTNNRQIAFVDVREGGGRILYLEGALREEYKFLRRALKGFPDLDLTQRWIPEDTQSVWPVDLSSLVENRKFDVFILGDLDASALGPAQLDRLARAVDSGAGLLTLGGFQSYSLGGYAQSPLADVLPIELDARNRRTIDQRLAADEKDEDVDVAGLIASPVTLSLARRHPLTDLGQADRRWDELPRQLGANRWPGVKLLPGADVLLESGDGDPMMVVGNYGRGRIVSVAFDSTWRWWRAGRSDVHRRFWRQVMLWLMSREESHDNQIVIKMDQRRFASSDPSGFGASLQTTNVALDATEWSAQVVRTNGDPKSRPLEVTQVKSTGSSSALTAIKGTIPELEPGIYELRVQATVQSDAVSAGKMAFQVVDRSAELARPMADPVFMQQLAQQTRDQGGRSFSPDEVNELIDAIKSRRRKAETAIVEKSRLGDGPKTAWPLFAIFAAALSTEWFLRRRWNLA